MRQYRAIWIDKSTSIKLDDFISDKRVMGHRVTIAGIAREALLKYMEDNREDQDEVQQMILRTLEDDEKGLRSWDHHKRISSVEHYSDRRRDTEHYKDQTDRMEKLYRTSKFNPRNRPEDE
jgi:hypothetical protein